MVIQGCFQDKTHHSIRFSNAIKSRQTSEYLNATSGFEYFTTKIPLQSLYAVIKNQTANQSQQWGMRYSDFNKV